MKSRLFFSTALLLPLTLGCAEKRVKTYDTTKTPAIFLGKKYGQTKVMQLEPKSLAK